MLTHVCQPERMTEATPARLRADAENALTPLGAERIQLLKRLDEIEQQLRPLVVRAIDCEVPFRRIQELTSVSPNTARAWKRATNG
jgi:hypothetical protein